MITTTTTDRHGPNFWRVAELHAKGMTDTNIARKCEPPISRERVRQIRSQHIPALQKNRYWLNPYDTCRKCQLVFHKTVEYNGNNCHYHRYEIKACVKCDRDFRGLTTSLLCKPCRVSLRNKKTRTGATE